MRCIIEFLDPHSANESFLVDGTITNSSGNQLTVSGKLPKTCQAGKFAIRVKILSSNMETVFYPKNLDLGFLDAGSDFEFNIDSPHTQILLDRNSPSRAINYSDMGGSIRTNLIKNAVRDIILAIGDNPDREGLKETPARVAKMYLNELFANTDVSNDEICQSVAKIFTEDVIEGIDKFGDMVIIKDIDFFSSCEHHLVTFYGKAHVGYIPSDKVIGLSKIARLVDAVSKRPQLQERLGKDIADCMEMMLQPKGIMVVIEGTHMCMVSRGVKKPGSTTVTSSCRGVFKDDSATRQEFLTLIGKGK